MVKRKEYLEKLCSWKDEKVIKVITGVRRCGKSTLLEQFYDMLLENGVNENQIIKINFEELENEHLLDYQALYKHIKVRLLENQKNYILLDEIQKVRGFEKAIDSLYVKENIDIYMTGSNAYMLSSDLATLLTGRYVEIKMLPLSFSEYKEIVKLDENKAFEEYLKTGSLPYVAVMEKSDEKLETYLEGIYNTVIIKDIEERQARKEADADKRKVSDIALLKMISRYLSSVIGSEVSVKKVCDYLVSTGRKVSQKTVSDYMESLSESFIFYPVERFDVVGKHLLKTNKKWYMVDLGLRNHILPRKNYDLGFSLENIVYFELLRRGYKINVGKIGANEIDFIAQKQGIITYFQVTADMTNEETFNREITPLKLIKDNYEKKILTLDRFTLGNYDGIKVINAIDWLEKKSD